MIPGKAAATSFVTVEPHAADLDRPVTRSHDCVDVRIVNNGILGRVSACRLGFPSTTEAAAAFLHELPEKQKGHKAFNAPWPGLSRINFETNVYSARPCSITDGIGHPSLDKSFEPQAAGVAEAAGNPFGSRVVAGVGTGVVDPQA